MASTSSHPEATTSLRGPDSLVEVTDAAFYDWKKQRSIETSQDGQEKTEKVRSRSQFALNPIPLARIALVGTGDLRNTLFPITSLIKSPFSNHTLYQSPFPSTVSSVLLSAWRKASISDR